MNIKFFLCTTDIARYLAMYTYHLVISVFLAITLDVRLVSTDTLPYTGRIEVFFNNEWGQVCYQDNDAVLSVVCAQLGYGSADAVPFSLSISRNIRIWLGNNVDCVGNEDSIFDCPSLEFTDIGKVVDGYCVNGAAGVICPICKSYYIYLVHIIL